MTNEIQSVISGKSQVRYGTNIQATISYLESSKNSGSLDKEDKYFKCEETERIRNYINNQNLWICVSCCQLFVLSLAAVTSIFD
jgi:ribosomal protein L37AE/L43A